MKKTTAGKSKPKKRTIHPDQKQPSATVVNDGSVEPDVSHPTTPVKKDQMMYHGTKSGDASIEPKVSFGDESDLQPSKTKSLHMGTSKNGIFS